METSTVVTESTSTSTVIPLLILAVLIAFLTLKAGAHLADAKRTGIIWCAASGVIGIASGYLFGSLLGGAMGGPFASFIGFVIAIRFMLGTSLVGALGLTIVATGVTVIGLLVLDKLF